METKLVHISEPYDICICRPSKWGNPYSWLNFTTAKFKVDTRKEAVQKYESYVRNSPELMNALKELMGKRIACVCRDSPCHGDVLIRLINEMIMEDLLLGLE